MGDDESKTAELNSRKKYPLHADRRQRNMSYDMDELRGGDDVINQLRQKTADPLPLPDGIWQGNMGYEIDITDIDIGKGGYGKILKGWYGTKTRDVHGVQRVMGPCVAYKLPSDDSNKSKLLQLKNEIHILRKLRNKQHPNIVKVYEMWETEFIHKGKPISTCIAMEYCSRGSFKNLMEREIEKERYLERHFIDLLWQAACAVEFLHNNGIVHADIKPSNFVVTRNGVVKLIDFGSAFEDDFVKFLTAVDIGFEETDVSSFKNEGYNSEFLLRNFFNNNEEEVKNQFKKKICRGKNFHFQTAFYKLRRLCEERGYASPKGTHGYYPEEFNITGPTKKTDVYSFGKMMMVLVGCNEDLRFEKTERQLYKIKNRTDSSSGIYLKENELNVFLEIVRATNLTQDRRPNMSYVKNSLFKISGNDDWIENKNDKNITMFQNILASGNFNKKVEKTMMKKFNWSQRKMDTLKSWSSAIQGNGENNCDIINEIERIKDVKLSIHDWLSPRIINDSFDSHEHHITDYLLKFNKRVHDNEETRKKKINVCYCGSGNGATVIRKAVEETKRISNGLGFKNEFDIELHADFT